jgi:hypothetical protein
LNAARTSPSAGGSRKQETREKSGYEREKPRKGLSHFAGPTRLPDGLSAIGTTSCPDSAHEFVSSERVVAESRIPFSYVDHSRC